MCERHEVDPFFMSIPSLTSEMDPELAQIGAILDDKVATALCQSLYSFMQRAAEGKQVLARVQVVILFEPHTDIIIGGKPKREVEFWVKPHLSMTTTSVCTR